MVKFTFKGSPVIKVIVQLNPSVFLTYFNPGGHGHGGLPESILVVNFNVIPKEVKSIIRRKVFIYLALLRHLNYFPTEKNGKDQYCINPTPFHHHKVKPILKEINSLARWITI